MGSRRTQEPTWRFWAKELLFFGIGVAIGWEYRRRQQRVQGPDAPVALTPEERAPLESQDDSP